MKQVLAREASELISLTLSSFRDYFNLRGFQEVFLPRITNCAGACEDIETMFDLDFYGQNAFLAQTSQPYLELCLERFNKVFTVSRCFRKETRVSKRHLSEYIHVESEIYVSSLEVLIKEVENLLLYLYDALKNESIFNSINMDFQIISYSEAIKIINKNKTLKRWGTDLSYEDEVTIVNHFNAPVFVTHFPSSIKAFTFQRDSDQESVVLNADLLVPGVGEVLSIGIREKDIEKLKHSFKTSKQYHSMKQLNIPIADYDWYFSYKESINSHTGGWGLGIERLLMWFCGYDDIRDLSLFPRYHCSSFKP